MRQFLATGVVLGVVLACGIGDARAAAAKESAITVTVSGLSCSTAAGSGAFRVASWSWGATNSTTVGGGGSGAGKTNLESLEVLKGFDACSPALFGGVATGKRFPTITLVQTDERGVPLVTVTLTDATVSAYLVGGSGAQAPGETVRLDFRKICMEEHASSNTVCYDAASAD